jgi:hypothetical protein
MLLIDGPLEWANVYENPTLAARGVTGLFEPVAHDIVAAIGDAQAAWVEFRNRGRQIEFMTYKNHRISTGSDGDGTSTAELVSFDFLLTTAKTPYFDDREKADLVAALEACARALEAGGYKTLVRLFDPMLLERVVAEHPTGQIDESVKFSDALALCRCVIGTPSSVLLEAMALNRPTAMLMFRDAPLFYQSGWLLGRHTSWEEGLESMCRGDPARMAIQQQTLEDNLSENDLIAYCANMALSPEKAPRRPFDTIDLDFENRVLHRLVGWPEKGLVSLVRRFFRPTSKSK